MLWVRLSRMRDLLDKGYDAIFVGSGAPRGKELKLPGRYDTNNIHIGIDWLESVAFGHIDHIGERVLIIGVGNTAMDCCRTSLRLGARDVKVMARKPRQFFKASNWELEDAEEEKVEIVVNHAPKAFVVEGGRLKGMVFELMEYTIEHGRIQDQEVTGEKFIPCDDVVLAIGQENAFPWIERDLGIEFNPWEEPVVDEVTYESTRQGVFFGGEVNADAVVGHGDLFGQKGFVVVGVQPGGAARNHGTVQLFHAFQGVSGFGAVDGRVAALINGGGTV